MVFQLVLDICGTKCKLENGLKALDFLDVNIDSMSNWLTKVEQNLDKIEDTQLPKKNLEDQIIFLKVRFITILFILVLINIYIFLCILYQHTLEIDCENWEKVKNLIDTHCSEFKSLKDPLCEDDIYRERFDIISNRYKLVLNRLRNNLTQLEVSLIILHY